MAKRVIVDEGTGRNTALWHEFQRVPGGQPWEYLSLSDAHPGMPDVEILDKLLHSNTVLLTGDCVLHERAIGQGSRSYTLDKQGQLTRQRQLVPDAIPISGAKRPHRPARRISPQGGRRRTTQIGSGLDV